MATLPMQDPDAAVTELERVVQAHKSSSGKTEPEIQVSVMKTWQLRLLSACVGGGLAVGGYAQDYPTKPIRMVIPFAPGGANDVIGRLVGMKLTDPEYSGGASLVAGQIREGSRRFGESQARIARFRYGRERQRQSSDGRVFQAAREGGYGACALQGSWHQGVRRAR